jgi:DNA recombination protein RmuC
MDTSFIMTAVLFFAGGAAAGWAFFILSSRKNESEIAGLRAKAESADSAIEDFKRQISERDAVLEEKRTMIETVKREKAVAETRMQETAKSIEDQKQLLDEARSKLSDTFKALSGDSLKSNNQAFLELAGKVIEPIKETLSKFEKQVGDIEKDRVGTYEALKSQIGTFNVLQENLQGETRKLVDALKRPQVRGRWGEITLRRVVEAAGMSEYCDFEEQVSVDTDEGRLRPDLLVRLPGDRTVVVDAKAPLKAYMEALEAKDEKVREEALQRHSQQVRDHLKLLGAKAYWSQFKPTPDYVVLFLPGESFFSAALENDRSLMEDSMSGKVILASPTTLIALLKAVSYGWQQQHMAENAEKIAKAGSELFDRICKFVEHLVDVRNNLENATHSFNKAVGSLESRLIPGAKKLKELGAAPADKDVEEIEHIDAAPRQLNVQ